MINVLPVAGVRQPRGVVKIQGNVVDGWIDSSVTNNTYFEADTFHVAFSASALVGTYDAEFFSSITTDTFVEILYGFPSNPDKPDPTELTSHIYARIDDIDYDPVNRIITLTGRDLTGALIDGKVPRDFVNKTASQVVATIAKAYSLASVITPTSGYVGSLSQDGGYELLHTEGSDWDLIANLARHVGFVAYVQQKTLYFQADTTGNTDPYVIQWTPPTDDVASPTANAIELSFTRSLTITKGVSVTVQAAGLSNKASVSRSYPTAPRAITPGKATPYGATTVYTYTLPAGSTPAECEAEALKRYTTIVSHAMKVKGTLPGDGLLSARGLVQVKGTGTDFDQTYFPRSVTRSMNMKDGYTMEVQGQNFTPNMAPVVSE